ncbi:MAG: cytochrome P450 (plasmid) [Leptolyngbya sp. BL-A-14]
MPVPTPKTPKLLQAAQWILDPIGYLTSNFERYGDIFAAQLVAGSDEPVLIVNEPKAMQYLLTHDMSKAFTAPGEPLLEPLVGQQSLMLLSGDPHRHRRQLVMPPFHGERLKAYGQMIQRLTQTLIGQWPLHTPLDVRQSMQQLTLRVILQVVFGLDQGERYSQLEHLLSMRLDMLSSPLSSTLLFLPWLQQDFGDWSPGARMRQLAATTDQLLFAEIQERRPQHEHEHMDILSLLLTAKDEAGHGLTDQALRDELMTLLLAGYETTATALTWAVYWLHHLPAVKQKLLAELDAVADPTDVDQVLPLPYLTAVCNETLRIHPVAMLTFPRRTTVPIKLCGHPIAAGTLIEGCIYLIHQRADLYPQPQQFRPERFLERQFSPYEFVPFGGGVRRCIGYALAQYELKLALATMLTQVDLTLVNTSPVRPARRGITLGQGAPVKVQKIGVRSPAKTALVS